MKLLNFDKEKQIIGQFYLKCSFINNGHQFLFKSMIKHLEMKFGH